MCWALEQQEALTIYQVGGKHNDNTFTLANLYPCLLSKWKCSLNVIVPLGVFFAASHLLTAPHPLCCEAGVGEVSLLLVT